MQEQNKNNCRLFFLIIRNSPLYGRSQSYRVDISKLDEIGGRSYRLYRARVSRLRASQVRVEYRCYLAHEWSHRIRDCDRGPLDGDEAVRSKVGQLRKFRREIRVVLACIVRKVDR